METQILTNKELTEKLGAISETLNNKNDIDFNNMNPSNTSKESIVGWGIPDYTAGIALSISILQNGYTAPSKGIVAGRYNPANANNFIKVNNSWVGAGYDPITPIYVIVDKGDIIKGNSFDSSYNDIYFYPLKGGN